MSNWFKRFSNWIGMTGGAEEGKTYQRHDEWSLIIKTIGDMDRKPSPAEIEEAYFRSFTFRQGRWHVGNHQLWEWFSIGDAEIASMSLPEPAKIIISVTDDEERFDGTLAVNCGAYGRLALNKGVPFERRHETANNFIEQLKIEYDKNINIVMAASDSRLSGGDI